MPARWTRPPPPPLVECHAAFDAALVTPTYGTGHARFPAYLNQDLLISFAEDDALGREELVTRYDARMARRFMRRGVRPDPDMRAWESAGNAVGWGVRLEILTEEVGPDGERRWRLVRREPTYALDKKWRLEKVAGLTREQQAARDKKSATDAKRTATLARKACVAAIPALAKRLGSILEVEPGCVVPQAWADKGFVVGWTAGVPIGTCFDTIRDAPLAGEFSKERLQAWRDALIYEQSQARRRVGDKTEEREMQRFKDRLMAESASPALAAIVSAAIDAPRVDSDQAPADEPTEIPDDDLDALDGL